jgi:RIO-like serine/threonine protein kinase
VLHGDVQSRHITVDSNGRVRIIDWEAGKSLNSYYEGERQYVLYEERKRVANLLML